TIAQALEDINAWEDFRSGMKVLIKPNVVMGGSPKISSRGITTTTEIVEEIIRLVREKEAGSVVIAEGSIELPTLKLDTAAAYLWGGYQALADKIDVPLIDMNKGPHRVFTLSDGTELEIAEAVFEADFVINVPILKTHNQTTTTICLKNLKGCLSMESKKVCHTETDLEKGIAEFNQFIPCHVNVVDALTATEIGPTPTGKVDQVREMGLLMASKDRLACDIVGSFLLGYPAEQVPVIVHYAKLTGGSLNLEDIPIIGEDPHQYRMELTNISEWGKELAEKFGVGGIKVLHYGTRICSACGFNLWAGFFNFCKANQGATVDGAELLIGRDAEPTGDAKHTVLLGKCALEEHRELEGVVKVPGCPPDPAKMAEIMARDLPIQPKES
ncbi:DUF362 domain-containing protein, partial [Thermodesulfobacteriota bacterium]